MWNRLVAITSRGIGRGVVAAYRFVPQAVLRTAFRSKAIVHLARKASTFLALGTTTATAGARTFSYRDALFQYANNDALPFYIGQSGRFDFDFDAFLRLIRPGDTVCDCGANIGVYAILAARRVGPTGRVLCFEPETSNANLLERNIAANAVTNIDLIRFGLSDAAGEARLHLSENAGQHSLVDSGGATQVITLRTLDDAVGEATTVDVIKLDVEGADVRALRGMQATIARCPQIRLYVEYSPNAIAAMGDDPAEMIDFLLERFSDVRLVDPRARRILPVERGNSTHAHLLNYNDWAELWPYNITAEARR